KLSVLFLPLYTDKMPSVKPKKKKTKKEISEVEEPQAGPEPAIEMEGLESHREPLTPEPPDNPPQKKKKKKKAHTLDESEQQDLSNGDVQEPHTDDEEVTKKSKRKRKAKMIENQPHNELGVEEEDIITDVHAPISQRSLFSAPLGHSHPMGKVFVEKNRRFQATDRLDLSRGHMEEYMEVRPMWNTRDVAMRVHSGFRPPGSEHQILQPWIVVNLVVALLVGLAWVFVATRPDMDYTEEFLMAMEVEEYPRHEKNELAA
uniref:Transmembrane protein 237A n=1 Tax=Sinocyclocheilus anshuiensis TaxID=1608454 RepID=A0A671K643_9TELE